MYSSLKPHEHALTMEIKKMGQTAFLELETICNLRIKNGHICREHWDKWIMLFVVEGGEPQCWKDPEYELRFSDLML